MSAKVNKSKTKAPRRVKQRRRRMLTFMRMCRYGVNSFSRNIWLTVAATAVMSITLLIIFATLVARNILTEVVSDISSKVEVSVYLRADAPEAEIMKLKGEIERLESVKSVRYISSAEAREDQASQNKQNLETLNAIREASNKMSATLRVSLVDINDTEPLNKFISGSKLYDKLRNPDKVVSLRGERRVAIERIGGWVRFAEISGGIATVVFVIISSLVVFNTIRMAIFNRRDEIQMMKLIGADRGFIRGPFIVEAIMYGFIAAIIATGVGYGLVFMSREPLARYEVPIGGVTDQLVGYIGFILLGMIITGATIGVLSSYVATRKYLKL